MMPTKEQRPQSTKQQGKIKLLRECFERCFYSKCSIAPGYFFYGLLVPEDNQLDILQCIPHIVDLSMHLNYVCNVSVSMSMQSM